MRPTLVASMHVAIRYVLDIYQLLEDLDFTTLR